MVFEAISGRQFKPPGRAAVQAAVECFGAELYAPRLARVECGHIHHHGGIGADAGLRSIRLRSVLVDDPVFPEPQAGGVVRNRGRERNVAIAYVESVSPFRSKRAGSEFFDAVQFHDVVDVVRLRVGSGESGREIGVCRCIPDIAVINLFSHS